MLAIEHNPTHIEHLSEGRGVNNEGSENRLGEITRKKGRKNNGLGAFGKLLAGLVSKKTLKQAEGNPNGLNLPEPTENKTKKEASKAGFLRLTELTEKKEADPLKERLAAAKKQKSTVLDQGLDAPYSLNPEFARLFSTEDRSSKITFEPVSMVADHSKPVRDLPERKTPFRREGITENDNHGDARNVSFISKKDERPVLQAADDRTEAKKNSRKRPSVEVFDLRTQMGTEAGTIAERGLKGALEPQTNSGKEIIVELRPSGEWNEKPAETGQKVPSGENFEQLLARELRGELSADIVKQAAIVLRDGGEGTIKLSLRPETLGKVKIHLEMAENRISGHIFVENEEALRAFEQEIHTLEQSFRDSGFEASLNAALDYKNDGQRWKEKPVEPFYSERFAASYEESSNVDFSGEFYTGFGINAVNVLA